MMMMMMIIIIKITIQIVMPMIHPLIAAAFIYRYI